MGADHPGRPDGRLVGAVFFAAVVCLVYQAIWARSGAPLFADTDDAMRMVMVRDFLAGQGWYDLVQHRLNTPWGAEIHWSRLVDLPIAALVALFRPVWGQAGAEVGAAYVWPMVLLGLLLWVSARLAFRLVGREGVLPAVLLPVLSPAITAEFTPGRVDHHNVVILITLAVLWTAVEGLRRPRYAFASGLLCATALAIATEALPAIVAAVVVFGCLWMASPDGATSTRRFGLAFGGGAVLHLALFRLPERWLEPACDVLSPIYVLLALVVSAAFTTVTLLPRAAALWSRALLLGAMGLGGLALVLALYPQCLAGPYGDLDPWLRRNWLTGIAEAKPWLISVADLPAYTLAVGMPVLLATLVIAYRLWRVPEDRGSWAAVLVFLICLEIVMLAQVRGARLAIMPAMPAAAWLIASARARYIGSPRPLAAAALLGSWLAFAGIVISLAVSNLIGVLPGRAQLVAQVRANKAPCLLLAAFDDLNKPAPARIMGPIDLGSHLRLYTGHAVVAAPYHRNEAGVLDAFRFFNQPIAEARAILVDRGIELVVTCPAMPEMRGLPTHASDSFVALADKGQLPPWLSPVAVAGPLHIYAVESGP